jgi:hypothetical protein
MSAALSSPRKTYLEEISFFDEGVASAVREYLNVAMWHASPRGVCKAIGEYLQSEKAAVEIMGIDAILCDLQEKRKRFQKGQPADE